MVDFKHIKNSVVGWFKNLTPPHIFFYSVNTPILIAMIVLPGYLMQTYSPEIQVWYEANETLFEVIWLPVTIGYVFLIFVPRIVISHLTAFLFDLEIRKEK